MILIAVPVTGRIEPSQKRANIIQYKPMKIVCGDDVKTYFRFSICLRVETKILGCSVQG